jgi:phytoene desaturase
MPIRDHVVVKESFCINDFEEKYHAYKGNAFGLAHTLFQTAIFRPSYRSKRLPEVYFVGQYTTPGVGTPIAVISGQVLAEHIAQIHAHR